MPRVDPGALRDLFKAMDKNHDGTVSRSEVIFALRKDEEVRVQLGLPRKFRQNDANHSKFELLFQAPSLSCHPVIHTLEDPLSLSTISRAT
jgi:hypothetical protein